MKKPNKESNNKIKEKLFTYSRLHPNSDKRDYSYIGISTFSLPSDFVFVTENFINLISYYIYKYK